MKGPVVIGGVGGSGTRVVAEILLKLNFYLGGALNEALDNNWFTFLFNRPKWYVRHRSIPADILTGMKIFERAMTVRIDLNSATVDYLRSALLDYFIPERRFFNQWEKRYSLRAGVFALRSIATMMLANQKSFSKKRGWGWKEPNSHIYLEWLARHFINMKYIHVIRHGLDMALSRNQRQLLHWGEMFNLKIPKSSQDLPKTSLQYWILANKRAIQLGREFLKEHFFLLNYDSLCQSPQETLRPLLHFLEIDLQGAEMEVLCRLPKTASSQGRYKNCDLSIFDAADLDAVKAMGFGIELPQADERSIL